MLWIALIKTCNNCTKARNCLRSIKHDRTHPYSGLYKDRYQWSTDFTVTGGKRVNMRYSGSDYNQNLSWYPATSCASFILRRRKKCSG
jgi:hypothetical protein